MQDPAKSECYTPQTKVKESQRFSRWNHWKTNVLCITFFFTTSDEGEGIARVQSLKSLNGRCATKYRFFQRHLLQIRLFPQIRDEYLQVIVLTRNLQCMARSSLQNLNHKLLDSPHHHRRAKVIYLYAYYIDNSMLYHCDRMYYNIIFQPACKVETLI